jgi:hypothetical protein
MTADSMSVFDRLIPEDWQRLIRTLLFGGSNPAFRFTGAILLSA